MQYFSQWVKLLLNICEKLSFGSINISSTYGATHLKKNHSCLLFIVGSWDVHLLLHNMWHFRKIGIRNRLSMSEDETILNVRSSVFCFIFFSQWWERKRKYGRGTTTLSMDTQLSYSQTYFSRCSFFILLWSKVWWKLISSLRPDTWD